MKATFCPLNVIPSTTAITPSTTVATRATRSCSSGSAWPRAHHVDPEVVRQRRRAREREPGHHREDRRERHRRDEAEERRSAQQLRQERRGHVAALVHRADRVRPDQHHRAEAEDERQQIEEPDEPRGVEHRCPRRARVGHGVEAHQDVRQARGAEHQRHAQRHGVQRLGDQLARRQHPVAVLLAPPRRRGAAGLMPKRSSTRSASSSAPASSRHRLHDLHPRRRDHPAEEHVADHRRRPRARSPSRTPARTSAG